MVNPIDSTPSKVLSPSSKKGSGDAEQTTDFSRVLADADVPDSMEVEDENLIREEKIKRLKAEVKAGTYLADSKEIAKTLALALERYI